MFTVRRRRILAGLAIGAATLTAAGRASAWDDGSGRICTADGQIITKATEQAWQQYLDTHPGSKPYHDGVVCVPPTTTTTTTVPRSTTSTTASPTTTAPSTSVSPPTSTSPSPTTVASSSSTTSVPPSTPSSDLPPTDMTCSTGCETPPTVQEQPPASPTSPPGSAPSSTLPATGGDATPFVAAGIATLLGGGALVLVARRKGAQG